MLQYSTGYFVDAIKNELAGFGDGPNEASSALSALKHLGKQKFRRSEFQAALTEELGKVDNTTVNRLLTLLFYAGALGNSVGTSRGSYMQFYHRRDDVAIHLNGTLMLANPLVSAWSIPFV